jgi:hypothetical protein
MAWINRSKHNIFDLPTTLPSYSNLHPYASTLDIVDIFACSILHCAELSFPIFINKANLRQRQSRHRSHSLLYAILSTIVFLCVNAYIWMLVCMRMWNCDLFVCGCKIHLVGVLVHGTIIQPYVYSTLENIASDSNLTVECIQRTLTKVEEQTKAPLPKTLFLQMDNCSRENKNKYQHKQLLTNKQTYKHSYIHIYIHTYIHTYLLTYLLTYIHTYIQGYWRFLQDNLPSHKAKSVERWSTIASSRISWSQPSRESVELAET